MKQIHIFALIGVIALLVIAGALAFISLKSPGSAASTGGNPISISNFQYTNDPSGQYTNVFSAQVALGNGGTYLTGVTSPSVQGSSSDGSVKSAQNFTVTYDLNTLYCRYPLNQSKQTISRLNVNSYQPPNAPFQPGWSLSCSSAGFSSTGAVINLLGGKVYQPYSTANNANGQPVYCNAVPSVCYGDFAQQCANKGAGYRLVSCTIPSAQFDGIAQSILGSNPQSGTACANISDIDPITPDYSIQLPISKNLVSSAVVTETLSNGKSESFTLASGTGSSSMVQGQTTDVYGSMTYSLPSFNAQCPEYSNLIYVRPAVTGPGIINAGPFTPAANIIPQYSTVKGATYNTLDQMQSAVSSFDTSLTYAFGTSQIDFTYTLPSGTGASLASEFDRDVSANPPAFPVLNLYTNAAWIGVVSPTVAPKLSSVTPNPISFNNGQQGTGTFTITNSGTAAGAVTVSLPNCGGPGTVTASWINNPNSMTIQPGGSIIGSFSVGANTGAYQCTITAQSSGYQTGGNQNSVSTSFALNVGQACAQPTPPFILQPTATNACNIVCPLDPVIAGKDVCASSGLVFNASACACQPPVNCALLGTCPPSTKCSDGTNIGICNTVGQRCLYNAMNQTVLTADSTCGPTPCPTGQQMSNGVCVPIPPPAACLPLVQKQITTAVGGISFFGFNIGGTPTNSCVVDPFGIGLILTAIGLIIAIVGAVKMKGGRIHPLLLIGGLLLLAGLASIGFSIIADNALIAAFGGYFVIVMTILAVVIFVLVKVGKYV